MCIVFIGSRSSRLSCSSNLNTAIFPVSDRIFLILVAARRKPAQINLEFAGPIQANSPRFTRIRAPILDAPRRTHHDRLVSSPFAKTLKNPNKSTLFPFVSSLHSLYPKNVHLCPSLVAARRQPAQINLGFAGPIQANSPRFTGIRAQILNAPRNTQHVSGAMHHEQSPNPP